ncbi:hypothetical protein ALC53_07474 [Atta colombica]|uniref:Uncharacterized protein n=1 Tax=Atta colombica TaxID=520822 RepID=A0A195BCX8_9HYME|nr:hypothetical protein ALC53_07474 [Atta colombica]
MSLICGKAAISSDFTYGIGVSTPVMRMTAILALTSAPMPHCGQPCSTVNRCFVFITDCMMVSMSNGLRERRLITSASIPFPASSLAASRASSTALECATNVT